MKTTNISKNLNKVIVLLITALLLVAVIPCGSNALSKGSVKIGQATNGEGGKLRGCRAGDQSGGEVSVSNWSYASGSGSSYHWEYVFRAKNPMIAKKISKVMKEIAANNHVGYDKNAPDRYTLYDQAKANNWDVTKITKDCETTCSSAVAVALNCAGVRVPKLLYSQIVYKEIMKTKKFDCYTTSDYTASPSKLMRGDILCNPKHHTAMVVESPNPFEFNVKYINTEGKKKIAKVTEKENIKLVLNNGEDAKVVKITKNVNLKDMEPQKGGSTFKGWKKVGDKVFSAKYVNAYAPILLNNGMIKLE